MTHNRDFNDINSIVNFYDYDSFREAITNLALNAPQTLSDLLLELPRTPGYVSCVEKPYKPLDDKPILGIGGGGGFRRLSDEEAIERLAVRSAKQHLCVSSQMEIRSGAQPLYSDRDLSQTVHNLFSNHAAEAILFLLRQVEPEQQREFFKAFLSPENLAGYAHVDIIVRRIEHDGMMSGNRGRYLIYTSKDGSEEQLLKFTHQASCVYYLMFLIDRKQKEGILGPIDIVDNSMAFYALYRQVYDISDDDLFRRIENLKQRRDEHGYYRVGRLKETIYDIRKRVQERFVDYDESFLPYVMTANTHLAVSPDRIQFVGEAGHLLEENRFNNYNSWR